MKKIIFWSLLSLVFVITLFFHEQSISENGEVEQEAEEDIEDVEEIEGTRFSGYYYYGYFDEREKGDIEFERKYFYYMNRHFKDYLERDWIILQGNNNEEAEEEEESYMAYFESIGGLKLYTLPATGLDLNNGDYITFIVTSPILESYPGQIQDIKDAEILYEF